MQPEVCAIPENIYCKFVRSQLLNDRIKPQAVYILAEIEVRGLRILRVKSKVGLGYFYLESNHYHYQFKTLIETALFSYVILGNGNGYFLGNFATSRKVS
jgi:hypothetical protein